jgi:hypothetical protein
MTNLIAQIAKLGQLTLGNAQYNDFAAPGLNLDMANSLMERAEARAGTDPFEAAELRDAAQQFLSVVR